MIEKTADEMLEELGYVNKEYSNMIIYGKNEETYNKTKITTLITFNKNTKNVEINPHSVKHYIVFTTTINVELHKAITKKMEELGWL